MRKKLFAILMSAMMMVTFMPAMAFATAEPVVTWGEKYATVTVTVGTESATVNTVRTLVTKTGDNTKWNGTIQAVPNAAEIAADTTMDSNVKAAMESLKAYFYDVDGATLQYGGEVLQSELKNTSAMPTKFNKSDFKGIFASGTYAYTGLELVAPSYVEQDKTITNNKIVRVSANYGHGAKNTIDNWNFSLTLPEDYDDASYAEQEFTVPVIFAAKKAIDLGDKDQPDLVGSVSKNFTVAKSVPKTNEALFWVDAVTSIDDVMKEGKDSQVTFDGSEHTIVMKELEGLSVTWKQYNYKAGKYEAVDAPKFQTVNKPTEPYKFEATVSADKQTPTPYILTVDVNKAVVTFGFESDAPKVVRGQAYTAMDFVKATNPDKKVQAFIDAHKAEVAEYISDNYDVTATPVAYTDDVNLAIAIKSDLTSEETAALAKKWKALEANVTVELDNADATLHIVDGKLVNEVEFTSAPSSKTFKAKKLKKAAKSFTVKAEALSGAAVSYKLINANSKIKIDKASGKITLKKGLKKGTYKIKVKAYVQAGLGYGAASETQSITVKVKK
ncbi:MAG: cadherin repeat domain-containing protein [Clostridiales bacterium]|nr:cadherin repeat domain-containing protein [Candidatus Crickella equi]